MSIPKDHHYIPRMLLKRFTDEEGNLYAYDKSHPSRGIRKRAPKNLFFKRHLYTQVAEDGTRDASVETEFLSRLESDASPVIEKIVSAARRGGPPSLSLTERGIWAAFTYVQFKRVPEMREMHKEEIFQEIRREIDFMRQFRRFADHELSVLHDEEKMERLWRNISIQGVQKPLSKEGTEIFLEKRIGVAVIRNAKPKRSFVIGSNPIVRMSHPERSHLADATVELWLPLARDVAVSPCPGESDSVISVNDRHIRAINRSVFEQSTVIAGCSRDLIESLLDEETRNFRGTGEK